MNSSKAMIVAAVFVLAAAAYAQAPDLAHMDVVQKAVPDGPVAKVFDANISADDFLSLYQSDLQQFAHLQGSAVTDVDRVKIGLYSLRKLVEREILYREAVKRKYEVPEADLQKAYSEEMDVIRKGMSQGKGTEISEADVLQHAGATKEQALADLRKSLMVERMRNEIIKEAKVTVDPKDVDEVLDKNKDKLKHPDLVRINHILIKFEGPKGMVSDEAKRKAKARAEEVLKKLQSGMSFTAVAKTDSDAPGADNGGQLDLMPLSSMPAFYQKALETMKPGDISGLIESEYGYHIIQLMEWVPAGEADTKDVRSRIEAQLKMQKGMNAVTDYCQDIIAKNADNIQIYLQLEKVLAYHPDFQVDEDEARAGANAAGPKDSTPKDTPKGGK